MNSDFATTAQQLLEGYSVLETNHLYEHGNDKDKLLAQLVAAHEADKPQDGSESAQTPITPLGDNAAGSRSDGWAGEHEDAPWGQEAE